MKKVDPDPHVGVQTHRGIGSSIPLLVWDHIARPIGSSIVTEVADQVDAEMSGRVVVRRTW